MPETDIPTVSLVAHLLAHKDIDSAVIAEITRILFEHRNELVVQHPLASTIGPPGAGETLSLPLHSGARAYYMQDQPGFLVQYAEVIAVFMSMAVLIISGLWQLRSRLQRSQKNRAEMYNNEILRLDDQIRKVEDLEQIDMYREQMFDIVRNVIEDYDVDRISFEAFQSFTLPWEVAIRTIRHREMVLMDLPLSEDQ